MNYEKSMQDVIFKMLVDTRYIFYGLFLSELNKEFSDTEKTACIRKHKDSSNMTIVVGKEWWEKCLNNESRKKGEIIHQLEHVIREHLSDMSQDMFNDKTIAALAMDLSINQDIVEEIPKMDHNGKKCGVHIEDYKSLEKKKSSLYYYSTLMKAKEQKKESAKNGGSSKGASAKPGNKDGTTGDAGIDEFLDKVESGEIGDWHDGWGEITDGMGDKEKELLRKEIQEMTKRVAEETSKMQGHLPSHIANAIKENFNNVEPVISWRTLFNRFIGSTMTTEIRQTRKRPNFRFEDAPTNKYKNKIRIVVGCDSSGSVSDYDLVEFFGQIRHMWKAGVKVDVCMWDAECEDSYEYKGEQTYKRTKSGGTRASCFTEHVNEKNKKFNWTCAIGLTDGYVESRVTDTKIPLLWVITKDGSEGFESKGRKVKIN